ncbi:MAG TPA: DUF559 domain-containing protein [Solirubrobacterales bacterium]|nr:DUF559 domain-containing protein [Solirubrobacterales bacterium]
MRDEKLIALAGSQFNRVSRSQLLELGMTGAAIDRHIASGRLVIAEQGVFAIAPLLEHDPWGRWMAATLTAPRTVLSRTSAGEAYGIGSWGRKFLTVTRPGNGGPRRHGGLLVYRSTTLEGECTELRGIPITTVARTLLDLACMVSRRDLARALREAVRLELVSLDGLLGTLAACRRHRGTRSLMSAIVRYSGLPIERARSGAEVRALEVLRAANRPLPRLNVRIAGEEADLSWPRHRLIVEIDGAPFHLDRGEDARKEAAWTNAGWTVRRVSSSDVYDRPDRLLALAPPNSSRMPS